jgi:hypothetical protein
MKKGDNFTVDGKRFHTTETPGTHQLLRVQWPNKTGRAHFGYVVRANDGEVVAAIHQGGAWSWRFKLKYEPEELKKNHHEEGWVRENLMQNCLNSVMSGLKKKADK